MQPFAVVVVVAVVVASHDEPDCILLGVVGESGLACAAQGAGLVFLLFLGGLGVVVGVVVVVDGGAPGLASKNLLVVAKCSAK